jgi:hypothetical protein
MVVKLSLLPTYLPTYLQTNKQPTSPYISTNYPTGVPHELKSAFSHQQGVGYMGHTISSMHHDDDVSTLMLEVANSSDGCPHALLLPC